MRWARGWATRCLWGIVPALLVAACAPAPTVKLLEAIRERGELRVATLNGPTAYYLGAHGPEGLEYNLVHAFARQLGVGLFVYPVADERALRSELAEGRADLAAAQLTFGPAWRKVGLASRPYDEVRQVVIYRQGRPRPTSLEALQSARLVVEADSEQLRILRELREERLPDLVWQETAGQAAESPLALVARGKADAAVMDARKFAFIRPLYPSLGIAFTLPVERPLHWIVRRGGRDLLEEVNAFFAESERSGRLAKVIEQSSVASGRVRPEATRELPSHIAQRLPALQPLFEQASIDTGIDWRLIAAVGYQESQWDPKAESFNGAQGVMMLMSDTAAALGVRDAWDARENILAGARYIAQMHDKIPERVPEPDRTWMALAAYNVGFGHLEDARVLAQKRGKDPDRWADVRAQLPLLAEERWYSQVKRGYARGWEPVQFVDRIQQFLNVLEWRHATDAAGLAVSAPAPAVGAESAPAPLTP